MRETEEENLAYACLHFWTCAMLVWPQNWLWFIKSIKWVNQKCNFCDLAMVRSRHKRLHTHSSMRFAKLVLLWACIRLRFRSTVWFGSWSGLMEFLLFGFWPYIFKSMGLGVRERRNKIIDSRMVWGKPWIGRVPRSVPEINLPVCKLSSQLWCKLKEVPKSCTSTQPLSLALAPLAMPEGGGNCCNHQPARSPSNPFYAGSLSEAHTERVAQLWHNLQISPAQTGALPEWKCFQPGLGADQLRF